MTVLLYNKFRVLTNRAFAAKALDDAAVQSVLKEINDRLNTLRGPTARKSAKKQ